MSPTLLLSSFISSRGGDTSSRLRYLLSSRLAAGGGRSCTWERLRAHGSAPASNVCCSGTALFAAICDLLLSNSPGWAWLGWGWPGWAWAWPGPGPVQTCFRGAAGCSGPTSTQQDHTVPLLSRASAYSERLRYANTPACMG